MRIKEKLQHIIKNSLIELQVSKKLNEIIIEPSKENNCDYYTNIAITLAKDLHKKPEEIADKLKEIIKDESIEKLEVVYPGTINIYLNKYYILSGITEIIEKNINYGRSNIGESRKINIEFINNKFSKKLGISNIFNAIYGDNLSRILKFNGFDVTKEYYINDTSYEIEKLAESAKKKYEDICKMKTQNKEKKTTRDTAIDIYNLYGDTKLNEKLDYFKKEEISTIIDNNKIKLDRYRINYDTYANEQMLYDKGIVDNILDKLNRKGYTYFKEDKLWIQITDFNDIEDRILIDSDGTYSNLLPILAYHIDRLNRKYDGLIDVYNIEDRKNKQVLKPVLKMLEQDTNKLEIKILPELKIKNNNQEITELEELEKLSEVNSIRYIFSSQKTNENIEIDLIEQNSINYIEKTNIIIHQILSNYNKKITKVKKFSTINNPLAYIILNKLYEFEDIVIIAGLKQKPHLICNYLLELTEYFTEYYKKEKIINEDEIYTNERLNLLLAIKIVINNALDLIGIIPREE